MKILKISVLFIVIISLTTTAVLAADISSILQSGQDFLLIGDSETDTIDEEQLKKVNSNIFNIFLAVGIVIAIVIGAVLGIQFMTSGIEGQAKIKEAVVPYLIGCVVIFGAFGIWKIAVSIGENTYDAENGIEDAIKKAALFTEKDEKAVVGDILSDFLSLHKNRENLGEYNRAYYLTLKILIYESYLDGNNDVYEISNAKDNLKKAISYGIGERTDSATASLFETLKNCKLKSPDNIQALERLDSLEELEEVVNRQYQL